MLGEKGRSTQLGTRLPRTGAGVLRQLRGCTSTESELMEHSLRAVLPPHPLAGTAWCIAAPVPASVPGSPFRYAYIRFPALLLSVPVTTAQVEGTAVLLDHKAYRFGLKTRCCICASQPSARKV